MIKGLLGEFMIETIYVAGGCLWGVQEFMKHLPGVVNTEAGRVNGTTKTTDSSYDGYAECVKTDFDTEIVSVEEIVDYLFEIIDPISVNKQGEDVGPKYRTGVYSLDSSHLFRVRAHVANIQQSFDLAGKGKIVLEIKNVDNYIPSDDEHQDRLTHFPDGYCHIPIDLLYKYKNK